MHTQTHTHNPQQTSWLGLSRQTICQQHGNQADIVHFASMTHIPSLNMVFQFHKQRCSQVWHLP